MIAIIPARGGSKGLPGKNVKMLLEKPLIAYTIEAALKSTCVTEVIVSTDDEEIAHIAIQHGARMPFLRPQNLATDDSPAIDTYLYTIDKLEKENGSTINEIMILLPTCPLRTALDIDEAFKLFELKSADSVVSYTEEHHPVLWHKYLTPDNKFINIWDQDNMNNRQVYQKTYYPNGAIYIFKKSILLDRKYYNENSFAYVMPRRRSIDIDTLEDFHLASFYLMNHVE